MGIFYIRYYLATVILYFTLPGTRSEEVTVVNRCGERLLIRNEGGNRGPFFLNQGDAKIYFQRGDSRPRVWALAGCSNENGDGCRAPGDYQSLAEFHWDSWDRGGKMFFDVSQVDGYTLPITITPYTQGNPAECTSANCKFDLNQCPPSGRCPNCFQGPNIVACKNPNRDQQTDYSVTMNRICPNAYAWSKDDQRRPSPQRFSCNPDSDNNKNGLVVIFC